MESVQRAVLWDMDGVLVDTGEAHYQSWAEALAGLGIPFNRELFRRTFGMNNDTILVTLAGRPLDPDFLKRVGDRKEMLWRAAIHGKIQPLPGAKELLVSLHRAGFQQAVASSAPMENITAVVDELDLRPYFQALVSGNAIPGKPEPDVFLEAARQVGVPPERCTVLEDAMAGVEAARRAGMRCIAVTTTNPREALQGAGRVVDSLAQVRAADFEE